MAIYVKRDKRRKTLRVVEPQAKDLVDWGSWEREVEDLLRLHPQRVFLDERLLVVGQQVRIRNLGRRSGTSDLTAVDAQGSLVLIEIRRDLSDVKYRKERFELQAIRYAPAYAKIRTPEELVEHVFAPYVDSHRDDFADLRGSAVEHARHTLNGFLEMHGAQASFNTRQRIILVAARIDQVTLSSAAWLRNHGVDICCYEMNPVSIQSEGILRGQVRALNPERVLPSGRPLEDYYAGMPGGQVQKGDVTSTRLAPPRDTLPTESKGLPRVRQLFEWGILRPAQKIEIRGHPGSGAEVSTETLVRFRGKMMSYNAWGKLATGWRAVNIYDWAVDVKTGKTLGELRAEKLRQMEQSGE